MPELENGYHYMIGATVLICTSLFIWLKRSKWL